MNQKYRPIAFRPPARAVLLLGALGAGFLLGGCGIFGHRGSSNAAVVAAAPPAAVKIVPVVRPAADFAIVGAGGKTFALKSLRGQPVVLIIASSPDEKMLRKQVSRIDNLYLDLSERKTVFVAAFTAQSGRVMSNVPYSIAQNGGAVAKAYGVPPGGFAVVVISPGDNVDLLSPQVEAAQRLLDMINNSYQPQTASRTGLGS